MTYDKYTWQTGEVITAEKLNHMEDGIANAGGFECIDTSEILFDTTINATENTIYEQYTGAMVDYDFTARFGNDFNTYPTLTVTFDGVEYEATFYSGFYHGYPDNPDPFCLTIGNQVGVATQTTGEHTIKVELRNQQTNVTECFKRAVKTASTGGMFVTSERVYSGSKHGVEITKFPDGFYIDENTVLLIALDSYADIFVGGTWSADMSSSYFVPKATVPHLNNGSGAGEGSDQWINWKVYADSSEENKYPFHPTKFAINGYISKLENAEGFIRIYKLA